MRIRKLAPSGRVEGRWLCHLEDGTILRLGESEVVAFGLGTGKELSGAELSALTEAARAAQVREKAVELLSVRPLSRKELVEKLTARPRNREKEPLCGREAAEAAADWLEGLGYLDDGQYARAVAEHCAAKGYGPGRIREELYRRGVPRDCWDGALEGLSGPEEAIDAFLQKKLRGAELSDPKVRRRAADALARRGYRWEDISAGLRRYGAEPEEWEEERGGPPHVRKEQTMDTMEALLTRRSIRKYRPEPVPVEDLKEILAAGATAPSAVNMQHWYFVAVQDPAALEEVKAIMGGVVEKFQPVLEERFSRHPEQIGITNRFLSTLGGAPVCLLVFMLKPDYPDRDGAMQSVSAAIENVLLAAWAKGIGSCWLSAPQRMGFGPAFQRRFAPDKGEFVAAVTLGYPDQQPKMPPRRDGRYLIV